MSFASFAGKCVIETVCDENGNDCRLRLSCQVKDSNGTVHNLAREVDLAPLIAIVQEKLAPYYTTSEGDLVSGWGLGSLYKRASRTASSIAKNKALKSLYRQAKRIDLEQLKQISASLPPPYGPAAAGAIQGIQTGKKVYNIVQNARKGDPKAIAQLSTIRQAADNGDPKAIDTLTQAQLMLDKLKSKEASPGATTVSGDSLAALYYRGM